MNMLRVEKLTASRIVISKLGETLKIVHAKEPGYDIYIDKSDFTLDIFVAGIFAKRYTIGHGAVGKRQRQLNNLY